MLPLSNSNIGRRLFFSRNPLVRNTANTDAESVDDIVPANSSDVSKPTAADCIVNPKIHHTKKPVITDVSTTPTVASIKPCASTGRISAILVSMPPANRMMHNATVPMV